MSLSAVERETVITLNDEDETAEIWTAQRPCIRRTGCKRDSARRRLRISRRRQSLGQIQVTA